MTSALRLFRCGITRLVVCLAAALPWLAPSAGRGHDLPPLAIHSMTVPCGVAGALAAIDSPGTPERARFVLELTRRFYNTPLDSDRSEHPALAQLASWLSACTHAREAMQSLDPHGDGITLTDLQSHVGTHPLTSWPAAPSARWANALGLRLAGEPRALRVELSDEPGAEERRRAWARAGLDVGTLPAALDAGERVIGTIPDQTVPLPLSPETWSRRIFGGVVTADGLALAILTTRSAALLYTALLSLDEPTRAWLVGEPDLLESLHRDHVAALTKAAPAVRVAAGHINLPGGERARPVWEALVGRTADDAATFLPALLGKDRGVLAWFLASLHTVPAHHLETLLHLDAGDSAPRVAAASELYAAFRLAAHAWDPRARPFWRPAVDPALLLLELQPTSASPAGVPGTRGLWNAVFRRDHVDVSAREQQRVASGPPPTAGWLLSRVFVRDPAERRVRASQVLYAARQHDPLRVADPADVLTAVRAVRRLPALVLSLERAGIRDVNLVARLARRADAVGATRHATTAAIAHAQWQGSLALLLASAAEGSVSPSTLHQHLDELAALGAGRSGRFEGKVLDWVRGGEEEGRRSGGRRRRVGPASPKSGDEAAGREDGRTEGRAAGLADVVAERGVERAWLRLLSGLAATPSAAPAVTWEGTTYRLDVPAALSEQLDQARDRQPSPAIDLAVALRTVARRLETMASDEAVIAGYQADLQVLEPLVTASQVAADAFTAELRDQWRAAIDALSRTKGARDSHATAATAALTCAADALLARGLLELTYARVLADHEDLPLTSSAAASRHEFGTGAPGAARRRLPWTLPVASTAGRSWHVEGSLLALDVALAPSAVRRITAQVLTGRPTVNDMDRRTFVETVVLTSRTALTDASRDGIAAALAIGRAHARAAQTDAVQREAFATRAGMSAHRLELWDWMVAHEPHRAAHWVAPREWLHAGLDGTSVPDDWHAWGTSQWAATGCLCTRLAPSQPPERYTGHVGNSVVAVAVPDLQLRLAEALAQLGIPAVLARDVLSAAVYDLVNRASAQDHDDWRALVDHILGIDADRVEDYLALFTVDGPLRAVDTLGAGAQP